ncbi:MAG: metallophosphoesterase [Dehalococcoidia bacterium]
MTSRRRFGRAGSAGLLLAALFYTGAGTHAASMVGATAAITATGNQTPPSAGPVPVNRNGDAGATTTVQNPGVVSWVHIGDLHITTADQQNYQDLQTIIQNTNQYLLNGINFAVLPGDNANEGTAAEYQLIKQATDQLQAPLYDVPGDHDLKSGSLALYEQYLEPVPYQSFTADQYHFVFIDALDASPSGGFGLSADQLTWLTSDLEAAAQQGLQSVLFMHPYPSQLGSSAQAVQDLIDKDHVLLVDSGHTHYNDVANDGHTIYAATRSTGQVTEGPVGFSITNLDNGVVSWKFKPLGSWPFAMITSPADKQLITDPSQANQVVRGTIDLRAKVWDDKGVASATYQVDGGAAQPLTQIGTTQMWSAPLDSTQLSDGDHQVTVNVQGAGGNTTEDTVTITVNQAGTYQAPQHSDGASGNSIGAYAEKGLLGNHTAGGPGGAPKGGPGGAPKGGPGGAPKGAPSAGPKGAPGAGPKGAPSGAPGSGPGAGTATITAVNGNTLTLTLANGSTQQVTLNSATSILKEVTGSPGDLQPNQKVAVATTVASDGTVTATSIEIPKQ